MTLPEPVVLFFAFIGFAGFVCAVLLLVVLAVEVWRDGRDEGQEVFEETFREIRGLPVVDPHDTGRRG